MIRVYVAGPYSNGDVVLNIREATARRAAREGGET